MTPGRKVDSTTYVALHESFKESVYFTASIAGDFYDLLREVNDESALANNGYASDVFTRLLERADSGLLSIAFFGAFSSGKSFLISALCDRVTYSVRTENGQSREYYVSRIPASPRPTSSCPLAVEPLPASEKDDRFWVYFEDHQGWEEKAPAIPAVIQAYATDLPNSAVNRISSRDRIRTVLKARLGIASAPLSARLYDLPGIGTTNDNHVKIVREFVQQADCIVYIAWALRSLSNDDLDLLRHVYEHHRQTGKPVFFVLTQIDKATDFDSASGKPVWEDVRNANNEFLSKYFTTDGNRPDMGFIGDGFIPVSAGFEAKSRYYASLNRDESARLERDSQMGLLRSRFNDYLRNTSGPTHLIELTVELQKLLTRLTQDIHAREVVETTPRTGVQSALRGYKERRSVLIEGKKTLQTQLNDLGAAAIQRAFSGSDPDDLTNLLEERVKPKILAKDVLRSDVVHEIETEKATIAREWIARDRTALIPRWERAWESFVEQSDERIEKLLANSLQAQLEASEEKESVEADLAAVPTIRPSAPGRIGESTMRLTLDVLAKAWQTYAVVASVGGATVAASIIATATPALAILGPVGWALFATALLTGGVTRWKVHEERQTRREKMVEGLPQYANDVVEAYRRQANEFVGMQIGHAMEFLDNEIRRTMDSIEALQQRQLSGEYLNAERRIEALGRLLERCGEAESRISQNYSKAATIQPQLVANVTGGLKHGGSR